MARKDDPIGRLALREEGDYWVAYWAPPDTMEDASVLGSLHLMLAREPKLQTAFMELMKAALAHVVWETAGEQISWPNPPQFVPEHADGA